MMKLRASVTCLLILALAMSAGRAEGPANLTHREKMALLLDAESMIWLHEQLWKQPAEQLSEWWRLAMRQYNVLTATPVTALYR
jgi:membrane glycosyltransferase